MAVAALAGLPAASAGAAKVEHAAYQDMEVIRISGSIANGDDETFRALSLRYKKGLVLLDSPGGALAAAMEIGKIIRLAGYRTAVADQALCTSACALIWVAGSQRALSATGKIGFHAGYVRDNGEAEPIGVANAVVGRYLTLLDYPEKTVVFATMASPSEFLWLDEESRKNSGIDYEELGAADRVAAQLVMVKASPLPAQGNRRAPVNAPPPIIIQPSAKAKPGITVSDIKEILQESIKHPEIFKESFARTGLDSSYNDILFDHLTKIYEIPGLLDRMSQEVYKSRALFDGDGDNAHFVVIGQALAENLLVSGLARLPDARIEEFFGYLAEFPRGLSPQDCRAVFEGKANSWSEFQGVARTGRPSLIRYLALLREAMRAELLDQPAKTAPTAEQLSVGEAAFGNVFADQLKARDPNSRLRIGAALEKLEAANDADYCEAMSLILAAIRDMEGFPGIWYRRNYVNSIGK